MSGTGFQGFDLSPQARKEWEERVGQHPHIARSYVFGSRTSDNYTVGKSLHSTIQARVSQSLIVSLIIIIIIIIAAPYRFKITVQQGEVSRRKVFVKSSGWDAARSLTLLKNTADIWKVCEWSAVQVALIYHLSRRLIMLVICDIGAYTNSVSLSPLWNIGLLLIIIKHHHLLHEA
jgi:hypothetical protein